jgi:hypothetical protein
VKTANNYGLGTQYPISTFIDVDKEIPTTFSELDIFCSEIVKDCLCFDVIFYNFKNTTDPQYLSWLVSRLHSYSIGCRIYLTYSDLVKYRADRQYFCANAPLLIELNSHTFSNNIPVVNEDIFIIKSRDTALHLISRTKSFFPNNPIGLIGLYDLWIEKELYDCYNYMGEIL